MTIGTTILFAFIGTVVLMTPIFLIEAVLLVKKPLLKRMRSMASTTVAKLPWHRREPLLNSGS